MNGAFYKGRRIRGDPCQQGHCEEIQFLEWMVDVLNSNAQMADTHLTPDLIAVLEKHARGEFIQ